MEKNEEQGVTGGSLKILIIKGLIEGLAEIGDIDKQLGNRLIIDDWWKSLHSTNLKKMTTISIIFFYENTNYKTKNQYKKGHPVIIRWDALFSLRTID